MEWEERKINRGREEKRKNVGRREKKVEQEQAKQIKISTDGKKEM
jgi:hypothetical protein